MKASEFRIGNLAQTIQGVYKIESVNENEVFICPFLTNESFVVSIEALNPIPLTEEWLLKLGAKKFAGKIYLSITNLKAELHFDVYVDVIVSTLHSDFCELILDEIKYVHQLQNLYFALTNQELTLNK